MPRPLAAALAAILAGVAITVPSASMATAAEPTDSGAPSTVVTVAGGGQG